MKYSNKVRQAGLAKSDIEWEERALGKFVNAQKRERGTEVEKLFRINALYNE